VEGSALAHPPYLLSAPVPACPSSLCVLIMGKGADNSIKETKKQSKEVLIDGVLYDVTNLKHPGGTVIDFYAGKGIDATQAFTQFHIRSSKVKKYMASLPQRPADKQALEQSHPITGQKELLEDFQKFTKELEAEGFFKPSIPHVIYRIVEILFLYVVGAYMVRNNMMVLGIISMAIAQGRCGWLMHEGGHYSMLGESKSCIMLKL
jgi:acyl-CoA 6-desaturase (Delta-6 desaturase)